jgi:hypothetical protein
MSTPLVNRFSFYVLPLHQHRWPSSAQDSNLARLFYRKFNKIAEKNLNGQTICYIVDFISLLFYNLTTPWQLYCRTARYHLPFQGVRNNKIKQDTFFDGLEAIALPLSDLRKSVELESNQHVI